MTVRVETHRSYFTQNEAKTTWLYFFSLWLDDANSMGKIDPGNDTFFSSFSFYWHSCKYVKSTKKLKLNHNLSCVYICVVGGGEGVESRVGTKKPKYLLRQEDEWSGEGIPDAVASILCENSRIYGVGDSPYPIGIRRTQEAKETGVIFFQKEKM